MQGHRSSLSLPRALGRRLTGNRSCLQVRLHKTPLLRACQEDSGERFRDAFMRKTAVEAMKEKAAGQARATSPFSWDSASGLRAITTLVVVSRNSKTRAPYLTVLWFSPTGESDHGCCSTSLKLFPAAPLFSSKITNPSSARLPTTLSICPASVHPREEQKQAHWAWRRQV